MSLPRFLVAAVLAMALLTAHAAPGPKQGGGKNATAGAAGGAAAAQQKPTKGTVGTAAAKGRLYDFIGLKVLADCGGTVAEQLKKLWGSTVVDRSIADLMNKSLRTVAESNDDALLSLEDELEAAQAQLKKMGEQVAALTRQLSQCKGAGIQAKLDKCNRKMAKAMGGLAACEGERDELHSVVADLEVQLETCAAECSSGSDDTGATGEDEEPTWTTPEFTGEDNGEEGSEDPEFV